MANRIKTDLLKELLNIIKQNDAEMTFSETRFADWFFYNIGRPRQTTILSPDTYTGFGKSPTAALSKAISEYFERQAFVKGIHSATDGFAAYPNYPDIKSGLKHARKNALNEAVERFVWATWWDNKTRASIEIVKIEDLRHFQSIIEIINDHTPCSEIYKIKPEFSHDIPELNVELIVIYWKIKGSGFICAGAVGDKNNEMATLERVFAELVRHSLGVHRALTGTIEISTFYEKRLCFFASGSGNDLVYQRLLGNGESLVFLPRLLIDESVPHQFHQFISVYRCLFANQPDFFGGNLERLCI